MKNFHKDKNRQKTFLNWNDRPELSGIQPSDSKEKIPYILSTSLNLT